MSSVKVSMISIRAPCSRRRASARSMNARLSAPPRVKASRVTADSIASGSRQRAMSSRLSAPNIHNSSSSGYSLFSSRQVTAV